MNIVAKYAKKYNKSAVYRDRKNDYIRKSKHRGEQKWNQNGIVLKSFLQMILLESSILAPLWAPQSISVRPHMFGYQNIFQITEPLQMMDDWLFFRNWLTTGKTSAIIYFLIKRSQQDETIYCNFNWYQF